MKIYGVTRHRREHAFRSMAAIGGLLFISPMLVAQIGSAAFKVTTLAGSAGQSGSADGTGTAARFNHPDGVAVDTTGNVYVTDNDNGTIRKITPGGGVTTLAGSMGHSGSTDGTGSAARFNYPMGVAVDTSGTVYVADSWNGTIRKITPGGVVTTLAGSAGNFGSADGIGSSASFYYPKCVAVDGAGNVYVSDLFNCTIRKVTPGGVVTTLAGLAGQGGSTDGTGSAARFSQPYGVAVDSAGTVYVADSNYEIIRKITPGGVVTTLAGLAGHGGSNDGTGSSARFAFPDGLAADAYGTVYVTDNWNHTIRKITPGGAVTTLAGLADNFGSADGTGSVARFFYPIGAAVDTAGNVYVTDSSNYTIRKITSLISYLGDSGDFNGDGKSDILWRNTATGAVGMWLMNGTTITSYMAVDTVGSNWSIAGTGDFNGDGKPDILWRSSASGEVGVWLMNGTIVTSYVRIDNIDPAWVIAGTGDFNGDGKPDILWRSSTSGEVGVWLMNGTTITSYVRIDSVDPTQWSIAGTGDFNSDSKTDILWRNTTTGAVGVWLMNGTIITSYVPIDTVPTVWQIKN